MKKTAVLLLSAVLGIAVLGFGYTKVMARMGHGQAPPPVAEALRADHIVVSKADKVLYLMRDDRIIAQYHISMGKHWDAGHKLREGDERTPEGAYQIDWRNPKSMAHLSLHISYPDAADRERAEAAGVDPGGNIMIHGLPNGWGLVGALHRRFDWTDGCIAVTNAEMREIWSRVPNGTPITINASWQPSPQMS